MAARAVLLTTKAAVGGTLVVLPHLASTLGAPLACVVTIVVATAAAASCGVVLEEGAATPRRAATGWAPRLAVVPIAAFGFGMSAVYLVVIADVASSLAAVNRVAVAAAATAVLAPLSSPRSIGSTASFATSALGMAGVSVFGAITFGLCGLAAARGALHTPATAPLHPPTLATFAEAVSVTLNGVVVQQAITPIVRDCGVPAGQGPAVAAAGLGLTALIYLALPLACNALFGSDAVAPNVLTNFTPAALAPLVGGGGARAAGVVASVAQASVALCMAASYPLMHWAARDAVLELVRGRPPPPPLPGEEEGGGGGDGERPLLADGDGARPPSTATAAASPAALAATTTALALAALALAVTARDLRQAVGAVGGGAGSFIALLQPAVAAGRRGRWATAAALGGLGVAAFVGVFV